MQAALHSLLFSTLLYSTLWISVCRNRVFVCNYGENVRRNRKRAAQNRVWQKRRDLKKACLPFFTPQPVVQKRILVESRWSHTPQKPCRFSPNDTATSPAGETTAQPGISHNTAAASAWNETTAPRSSNLTGTNPLLSIPENGEKVSLQKETSAFFGPISLMGKCCNSLPIMVQ